MGQQAVFEVGDQIFIPADTRIRPLGRKNGKLAKRDLVVTVVRTRDAVTMPARWALNMREPRERLVAQGFDFAAFAELRRENYQEYCSREVMLEPPKLIWATGSGKLFEVAMLDVQPAAPLVPPAIDRLSRNNRGTADLRMGAHAG